MNILKFPLGSLQTNCYLLENENKCLLIDPADDAAFLLEEMQRRNLTLVAMLATHGHFDHVLAAGEIQLSFPVPLLIGREDLFLLKRLDSTAKHFLKYNPQTIIPQTLEYLKEKEITVGGFSLQAIHTPGHTPGSYSFYFKGDNYLFTGDTLFKKGIGSYEHSYSNKIDLFESLAKLKRIVGDAETYPGHEESTILSEELKLYHLS